MTDVSTCLIAVQRLQLRRTTPQAVLTQLSAGLYQFDSQHTFASQAVHGETEARALAVALPTASLPYWRPDLDGSLFRLCLLHRIVASF